MPFIGNKPTAVPLTSADIQDGTITLADLSATGTKDSTTFLRGDNTFNTPPLGGITMADQWRLTTSFTNDAAPISSNLERVDTDGFDKIGTGMSESSGIFSFPSTGVYLIIYQWYGTASVAQVYCTSAIEVTLNNSTYSPASYGEVSFYGVNTYSSSVCSHIVNVNDISNIKVRFTVDAVSANTSTSGNTGVTLTGFTFIRLGDAV